MIAIEFSVPDPPRVQPVEDPEAYLHAAAHSPETVVPYCLKRAQPADARGLRQWWNYSRTVIVMSGWEAQVTKWQPAELVETPACIPAITTRC
jgi:hypothetical protein